MSSIDRPLSGDVLLFDLAEEHSIARRSPTIERSGRTARTLLKDGALRVTLVVLAPGGEVAEHHASGPITIRPVEGRISFEANGRTLVVGPQQLLTAGSGVPHRVHSKEGAAFLLTVVNDAAR